MNLYYLGIPTKYVENKEDFYKSGIPEVSKLRNLITTCQRLFITNSKNINLYVGEGVYKIEVFDSKIIVCTLYYLPKEMRLDLYDGGGNSPTFIWKSKKCIHKDIPVVFDKVKAESLFLPLISVL